nr:MAG TPA: hypothetical protein [Caudoviricetes sp.]
MRRHQPSIHLVYKRLYLLSYLAILSMELRELHAPWGYLIPIHQ